MEGWQRLCKAENQLVSLSSVRFKHSVHIAEGGNAGKFSTDRNVHLFALRCSV